MFVKEKLNRYLKLLLIISKKSTKFSFKKMNDEVMFASQIKTKMNIEAS